MRRICRSWTCLVLLGWLAFCHLARAAETLALRLTPENGGEFRYRCELRNVGVRPIEILAFRTYEVVPWQFEYRTKKQPGAGEIRRWVSRPYVIIEAIGTSQGRMLLVLPEEKAGSRVPPRFDAEDKYLVVSGGIMEFTVDFSERPAQVVLTYYLRKDSGDLERQRLKKRLPWETKKPPIR